jgi:hypothetical protein
MKKLRVDLYSGYAGETYSDHTKFVQFTDEIIEDFIERITNVLFENIESLVEGQTDDET